MNDITITLRNLTDEQYKELNAIVLKFQSQESKSTRWEPIKDDNYWYLDSAADVLGTKYMNDYLDVCHYKLRNCFRTQEEAEFEAERKQVLAEIANYADEHNDGEISWWEHGANYGLVYDHEFNKITPIVYGQVENLGQVYFTSREVAKDCIKEVGEYRIKKYVFGVE